jgi:hypothetical protein
MQSALKKRSTSSTTPPAENVRFSRLVALALVVLLGVSGLVVLVHTAFDKRPAKAARPSIAAPQADPEVSRAWPVPEAILVEERADSGPDAKPLTITENVLVDRGPDCLPCAHRNGCLDPGQQGASCEGLVGNAVGCGAGVTEKDMCYKTMADVFKSGCADSTQEMPCLCGATDVLECTQGTATPTGPLYADYACDLKTRDVAAIMRDFRDTHYGVGSANVLIQCLGSFNCGCFGN